MRYPSDPPTVEEIIAVMRQAGDNRHGWRLRALIVALWCGGLPIREALALAEPDRFHEVIQAAMGWEGYHMHVFSDGAAEYGCHHPELGHLDESRISLDRLLEQVGDRIRYTYDFGDDWEHEIVLEETLVADPDVLTVRAPDAAFVSRAHADAVGRTEKYWPGPPDFAVEVVSPGDSFGEVEAKALGWLGAGTTAVLVLDPARRSATVYRARGDARVYDGDEEIDLSDAEPGWRASVADFFG